MPSRSNIKGKAFWVTHRLAKVGVIRPSYNKTSTQSTVTQCVILAVRLFELRKELKSLDKYKNSESAEPKVKV